MPAEDGKCCRCGDDCDGTFMRMDPRYTRVREMLKAPEVPRFSGGGISLCHWCQRAIYFNKGFLKTLIRDLQKGGRPPAKSKRGYDPRADKWDRILALTLAGKKVAEIAAEAGTHPTVVYDVLKKYGMPTPTKLRKAARRAAALDRIGRDKVERVAAMHIGGQSWDTIAAILAIKREDAIMAYHFGQTQ